MITIKRKEKIEKEYAFKDLCLGDCFLDEDGDVSIKISDDAYLVALSTGAMGWDVACAEPDEKVILVEATLIINSEK